MSKIILSAGILTAALFCGAELPGEATATQQGTLLSHAKESVCTVKIYGFFYQDQKITGTEQKVDRSGYYEIPSLTVGQKAKVLTDNLMGWENSIPTHFWNEQPKKIVVDIDLGRKCELERLEAWASNCRHNGNFIEEVDFYCSLNGMESDQLGLIAKVKNPYADAAEKQPDEYAFSASGDKKTARYVRIECKSARSPMMVLGEVKIWGTPLSSEKEVKSEAVSSSYRFELEDIQGMTPNNAPGLIGTGVWMKQIAFTVKIPETDGKPVYVWCRYFDNGPRTLEIRVNGQYTRLPEQSPDKYWSWGKAGVATGPEFNVVICPAGKDPAGGDSMIFSTDKAFDPNQVKDIETLKSIRKINRELGYAESLLSSNPEIGEREFTDQIKAHYGLGNPKPLSKVDDFGNVMFQGKPFFPVGFFHTGITDRRLDDAAVNTFFCSAQQLDDKIFEERKISGILTYHAEWRAYDIIISRLKKLQGNRNALMHYICDEPENVGVNARDLQILNAVVRAADPDTPTFLNVSANYSSNRNMLSITDYVGVDHYPIPNGRISDIGITLDNMRYNSDGRPVLFIAQSFDWSAYGRKDSRWPTPDELSAMVFTALIHYSRGLLFYEWPAPQMFSKTCIKDINPQLWERLQSLLLLVRRIEPALLGPELSAPYEIIVAGNRKLVPKFRLALTADSKKAFLLAVNPWNEKVAAELDFSAGPLRQVKMNPVLTEGIKIGEKSPERFVFEFAPLSTAVYEVDAGKLDKLKRLSREDALAKLKLSLEKKSSRPEITVPYIADISRGIPWDKAADMLDSWQSMKRPDTARVAASPAGLHFQITMRIPKDSKPTQTKRDSEVWKDPSVELFFGSDAPNTKKYSQLIVNIGNTVADIEVDQGRGDAFNYAVNYQWNSKVNLSSELAEYYIDIPWAAVSEMTGTGTGGKIIFNLASGNGQTDWAGLTGGGYHVPSRFGLMILPAMK